MGDRMGDTVIGLLHPGEMGAAVAGCLTARGQDVRWVSQGRGPATAQRAGRAGLADAGTIAALAGQAGIILSVCPPHAALGTARAVAAAGFTGVYADANAISPGTARQVRAVVEAAGGRYVDGGIVGPPPGPMASGGSSPPAGRAGRHPAVPVRRPRPRGPGRPRRGGRGPLRGHCPETRNSPQRKPHRGVGPQDGVRRLDQGQCRADPRGARAGPGRGGGGQPCWRSGRCPSRGWTAGRWGRPGPPRPRAGAGPARWRRSAPA